jgi:predicted anti-sigma-YlaC factor YlaD
VSVQDAGRPHDATCEEILAAYSDYLDGLLVPHEAAKVQWHLASCAGCARYDRVVRRSTELVRELPEVAPADDFAERLQHRLYHVQDGEVIAETRGAAGAAATIAVAGVIALLAWSPLFVGGTDGPTAAMAWETDGSADTPLDLTTHAGDAWGAAGLIPLAAPAIMSLRGGDAVQVLASFPGPYSPLVVTPPAHRTVRTISIE